MMQVVYELSDPTQKKFDLLAVAVGSKGLSSAPYKAVLNKALGTKFLSDTIKGADFTGKSGSAIGLYTMGKLPSTKLVLLGTGEGSAKAADWLALGGSVRRRADAIGAKTACLILPKGTAQEAVEPLVRGAMLAGYRFDTYLSEPGRKSTFKKLTIHIQGMTKKPAAGVARYADAVSSGMCLARDLVNTSPLQLYPESFGKKAQAMAKAEGLKCKVYAPTELKKMNMNLMMGVGQGSERLPRMVHLSYTPSKAKRGAKPIVLVGKGVTFDSGGLSLKPPSAMVDMKIDMGGGAAVVGTMMAIAKLKPNVAVHGIVGLAENMPSGSAIRPGDVITGAAKKSVEINNTDAEGRLVLADALHFATGLNPEYIIDMATLTGACVVALGNDTVGAFSNSDELAENILSASKNAGEDFWRMPLTESLRSQLNSDVADMKNTGERWGGAITAALFLREFIGSCTWAHLDIAGPVSRTKAGGAYARGGTGVAVATLTQLITGGV